MPKRVYERRKEYRFRKSLQEKISVCALKFGKKETAIVSELADFVGVSPSVVNNWLGKKDRESYPDVEQGYDIARYFDTNIQNMVTGEDPLNLYGCDVIREIVDTLENHANDRDLLIQVHGAIRMFLAEFSVTENERAASSE